jgi:four helix bundle protein
METRRESVDQRLWERTCPEAITSDLLWKLDAYRAALFLQHVSRADCQAIRAAHGSEFVEEQLRSAAGSVSAHLGEGYSRSTRADRLKFLGYALGSVRECVSWYQSARDILPNAIIEERLNLIMRNRTLILGLIRSMRERRSGRGGFEP